MQTPPPWLFSTFSIVAYSQSANEWAVAVASQHVAVGAVVPWAAAGVGAVATQSYVNPSYGKRGLDLMEQGRSASQTLEKLLGDDPLRQTRQVGFVDAHGDTATYTGESCLPSAGSIHKRHFCCLGNLLAGENVLHAMADAYERSNDRLGSRMIDALDAGRAAGGDSRGTRAGAIIVVRDKGGPGGYSDRCVDLRVDDSDAPILELRRLFNLLETTIQKNIDPRKEPTHAEH